MPLPRRSDPVRLTRDPERLAAMRVDELHHKRITPRALLGIFTAIDNPLGSHPYPVTATDVAGNETSATHGYVVFEDVRGPITNQARFAAGRVIPITLELGSAPQGGGVFAPGYPTVRQADCTTKDPIGDPSPADVQASVTGNGRVLLLWRTGGDWGGTCRSLVLRFAWDGWSDADAVFTLRFG